MASVIREPGLVDLVRQNVERIAHEQDQTVTVPDDLTLVDVERIAEMLGVPVGDLFLM